MLAEGNKIIAEGAGACPVAAVISGLCGKDAKKIVCVVCGGGIDNDKLKSILRGEVPENASSGGSTNFEDRLKALNYTLPSAPEPKGCYTPALYRHRSAHKAQFLSTQVVYNDPSAELFYNPITFNFDSTCTYQVSVVANGQDIV